MYGLAVERLVFPTIFQDTDWRLIPRIVKLFAKFSLSADNYDLKLYKVVHPLILDNIPVARTFDDILEIESKALLVPFSLTLSETFLLPVIRSCYLKKIIIVIIMFTKIRNRAGKRYKSRLLEIHILVLWTERYILVKLMRSMLIPLASSFTIGLMPLSLFGNNTSYYGYKIDKIK